MDGQKKKRIYKVLLVAGGAVGVLLAYALFVNIFGFGLPCLYKQTLGLECAGCGLSRASAALVRLDFQAAFSYNAVWPLYLCYGLWAGISAVWAYVKDGTPPSFPRPLWLNWVVLGAILAYGVIRNFI